VRRCPTPTSKRYVQFHPLHHTATHVRRSGARACNNCNRKAEAATAAAATNKKPNSTRPPTTITHPCIQPQSPHTYPHHRQREADQRASILSQILLPEAADRLNRIRLVKESRATDVENRLISLARSGQIRQKVTEEQLKELLGAMAEQQEKEESKIVVNRRGGGGWDDDDLDDLLKDV
jgi:programmed cell death protein 5